jgi:hypothetical protein
LTLDPSVIARYKTRGVLVDSSLLVVYLVGTFDRRHLVNCRAIKSSFSYPEFRLLSTIIGQFDIMITTPHVLTEVSNLAGKLPSALHSKFRAFFATIIAKFAEQNVRAVDIALAHDFVHFGITDTAISLISPGQYFVLTEEAALYALLAANGVDVMNFSHVRPLAFE